MANSCIAAARVDGKAGRIRLPTPLPKRAARRFSMQAQARSSLRGLTRTFGVSRTTVSRWITKKELSFLPSVPPWWLPIPTMLLPPPWNGMSSGRLCATKPRRSGCGLPCAARRDQWLPRRWGIGVNRRASGCGRPFPTAIVLVTASRIAGRLTRR
jgi:hypothetical protein